MNGQDNRQAYDRGTSLFSPDGRIHQVEYAREAVKRGSPSIGVVAEDGVALVASIGEQPDLVVEDSVDKLHKANDNIGIASAGHIADGRQLIDFARQYIQQDEVRYDEPPGVSDVTKAITDHVQQFTQSGGTRPYGAALLVAGVDDGVPSLHEVDPSGSTRQYQAKAIGINERKVMDFLSENYSEDLSLADAVELAIHALEKVMGRDSVRPETIQVGTVSQDEGFVYRENDEFDHLFSSNEEDEDNKGDDE